MLQPKKTNTEKYIKEELGVLRQKEIRFLLENLGFSR